MTSPASTDWRKYLKFRCTGCGNCCVGTVVMLTDADVGRITEGTGREVTEFVRFVPQADVHIPKRDPWWVRVGAQKAVMALKWKRGRCVFLDAENRCTIYEHRPVTCREHPFEIDVDAGRRITDIRLSTIVDCPHDWDGKISQREMKAVAAWNDRQSDAYLEKVIAWNRALSGRKTRPGFLRFLGFRV